MAPKGAREFGPGQKFPMGNVPPGLTVHVAVDEVYGQGPWRRVGDTSERPVPVS
jgi:hypothetical protein